MDKFDRIYQLHHILSGRRTPVPLEEITSRLECSRATAYRLIEMLRDYLGAPIERDSAGYRYIHTSDRATYELPGLWFTARELYALVTLQKLLTGLDPGLLEKHLSPLTRRLENLVQHKRLQLGEVDSRVRIVGLAARTLGESFRTVASATACKSVITHGARTSSPSVRSLRSASFTTATTGISTPGMNYAMPCARSRSIVSSKRLRHRKLTLKCRLVTWTTTSPALTASSPAKPTKLQSCASRPSGPDGLPMSAGIRSSPDNF